MSLDQDRITISCVIMASGEGKRFGSNKLLEEFQGKPLIEHILSRIPMESFHELILVTRYHEVVKIAERYQVSCILHDLARQSDTIALGVNQITDTTGCMFITCDQPLRTTDSIRRLIKQFRETPEAIVRLGYEDVVGNPVIFPNQYYRDLSNLQPGEKGSTIISKHRDEIQVVQANHPYELVDTDTREEFQRLLSIAKLME